MSGPRIAALIPTYDNPATIGKVVDAVRAHLSDVLVVDDGSGEEGARACAALAEAGRARVVRRVQNGGKGAAVKTGLDALSQLGFTHAFQVDADGQHALDDIPRFVALVRAHPDALVLGSPQFDASAPRARLLGRQITVGLVHFETAGKVITDPMCGFRVYPIEVARAVAARGDAMDFDPEVAVGIAWRGTPVLNLPTRVRYVTRAEGGVSHFRMVRDNLLIAWMHTRMVLALVPRLLRARRPRRIAP